MAYRIVGIDDPDLGPFKVSTLAYHYSITDSRNRELVAIHWHPNGVSTTRSPHIHLGRSVNSKTSPLPDRHHLATSRMTFEQAIKWAIEFGAEPLCDDWRDRLDLAESPHLLYRSWHQSPDEASR